MSDWTTLYKGHGASRDSIGSAFSGDIRRTLTRLAEMGHCDPTIQGRFTYETQGQLRAYRIRPIERGTPVSGEPLTNLSGLTSAVLTVLALESARTRHLHQFTAMLEWVAPVGRTFLVALHLEDDRSPSHADRHGSGACGHAAFHCHVGSSFQDKPEVRVPFPIVGPVGALDWLLTIVLSDWEPAPWATVLEAIAREAR